MERGHFLWKKRKIKKRSNRSRFTQLVPSKTCQPSSPPLFKSLGAVILTPHHAANTEQPHAQNIALARPSPFQHHGTSVTNNSNNNINVVPRSYYGSHDVLDSSRPPLSAATSSSSSSSGQQEPPTISMQFGRSSSSTSHQPAPRNWTSDDFDGSRR